MAVDIYVIHDTETICVSYERGKSILSALSKAKKFFSYTKQASEVERELTELREKNLQKKGKIWD